MVIAALFIVGKTWKKLKCSSVDKYKVIDIQQNIIQQQQQSEVLIHATAWMKLENIMVTKRSQSQKKPHIICFHIYVKYPEQANL